MNYNLTCNTSYKFFLGVYQMKKLKRNSVSDQVFQQLKEKIIQGDWKTGTRIPSENQLGEILGVSRVSIREALHKLVALGILETRHGEGTYVRQSLVESYFNELIPFFILGKTDIIKILEYRKIVEVGTIAIAVKNADERDISQLEDVYNDMDSYKGDIEKFSELDIRFHLILSDIADNPIINKINYIINDILSEGMKKITKNLGPSDGLYYHRKIIDTIKKKDINKAQELMEEHIEKTIVRMSKIDI